MVGLPDKIASIEPGSDNRDEAEEGGRRAPSSNIGRVPTTGGDVTVMANEDQIASILSVVRLGDLDHRGWWQSHGLDETGSFLLQRSFKRTWAATAMELSMVSARARHDEALGRKDAVHLFSDELPIYRLVHSWLLEQKLEDDLASFEPFKSATTGELVDQLPKPPDAERRAAGLYLGTFARSDLDDPMRLEEIVSDLLGTYSSLGQEFLAPYVDLAP